MPNVPATLRVCMFCEEEVAPFQPYMPIPYDVPGADRPGVGKAHFVCILRLLAGEEIRDGRKQRDIWDRDWNDLAARMIERIFTQE